MLSPTKSILIVAALIGVTASTNLKIDASLLRVLNNNQGANVLVNFAGGNKAALNFIAGRAFADRTEKINHLKAALESHAFTSQKNVQLFLNKNGVEFKSLWISNQIVIKKAPKEVVVKLAQFPEISKIWEEPTVKIDPIRSEKPAPKKADDELAWGLKTINVEAAWNITNGTGVVVGLVDTGARHTHEALKDSFYGVEYGWYDVINQEPLPYDHFVHGTHVQGTISGTKGVGIAPGSKWIACQSCASFFECDIGYWVECAEWMLCPTKPDGTSPDCSKAPHVINNSWGQGTGESYFDEVAAAWIAAGIQPIFAIGNSGSSCSTILHPGELENVIAAGATDIDDRIASFSSRGPTLDGRLKPDLSAPGVNVYSALPGSDDEYGTLSGTSMASPHTCGVAALILSVHPNITFTQLRDALTQGVDLSLSTTNATCGGIPDTEFPNHIFGHGRLNALKALQAAQKIVQ